jgi:hypothetical protein
MVEKVRVQYSTQGAWTNGRESYCLYRELAPAGGRVLVLSRELAQVRGKLEYSTQGACTNGRLSYCFTKKTCTNAQVRGKLFTQSLHQWERK